MYGNVLAQLGCEEAAGDAFRAALDANGRSSFAHVGLAQQSLLQGNLESARSLLEQARELAPTDGSIYPLLTRSMRDSGIPNRRPDPNCSPACTTSRVGRETPSSGRCAHSPQTRMPMPPKARG